MNHCLILQQVANFKKKHAINQNNYDRKSIDLQVYY